MTAFSNGTEFEIWATEWCYRCTKDDLGRGELGTYCPILSDVMALNEVPEQWSLGTDDLRDRYHCSEFECNDLPRTGL